MLEKKNPVIFNVDIKGIYFYFFNCQAIWFTEEKGQRDNIMENTVFGSADRWNGLGIFLDSFDNDNQVG